MTLSTNNELLVLAETELTFNITGCPIGYGADSNNLTCTVCDTDKYNIDGDFVRECLSCDPDINSGVFALPCLQSLTDSLKT